MNGHTDVDYVITPSLDLINAQTKLADTREKLNQALREKAEAWEQTRRVMDDWLETKTELRTTTAELARVTAELEAVTAIAVHYQSLLLNAARRAHALGLEYAEFDALIAALALI